MEQLFKVRYWDYSNQKFNLHGYICLSSSIAWGFLTIFMTHVIHKPIERAVLSLPVMWDILFVAVVTVVFTADAIVCTREALAFGQIPGGRPEAAPGSGYAPGPDGAFTDGCRGPSP